VMRSPPIVACALLSISRYKVNLAGDHMAAQPQPLDEVIRRVQGEYIEMPGLRLTLGQAQRLCGIERMLCKVVLDALVEAKFLCVKSDGAYARLIEGRDIPRPRPAKAHLEADARVVMAS